MKRVYDVVFVVLIVFICVKKMEETVYTKHTTAATVNCLKSALYPRHRQKEERRDFMT